MRSLLVLIAILSLFWMSNSGMFKPLLLSLGLASVALTTWLTWRLGIVGKGRGPINVARLPAYLAWLSVQVVQSNIDVVRRVWAGNGAISPVVKRIPLPELSDAGTVIYANSITLTPGTVSIDVDLEGRTLLIHALTGQGITDLESGKMARRVRALEH